MHRRFFNAMYVFNIVIQSIISLVSPIAVGILAAWLLTEKAGADSWIYVVLIILGVISGLFSMVRFTISSMAGIQRLENEQAEEERKRKRNAKSKECTDEQREK